LAFSHAFEFDFICYHDHELGIVDFGRELLHGTSGAPTLRIASIAHNWKKHELSLESGALSQMYLCIHVYIYMNLLV
jgi:hypothetical protein